MLQTWLLAEKGVKVVILQKDPFLSAFSLSRFILAIMPALTDVSHMFLLILGKKKFTL